MSFTPTPLDGSSTPLPMSSAVPDGTNTPLAVEGGPIKSTGGNNLVPVATYHYDGYDVTQGSSTDANTANTVMGRLTKIRDLLNGTLLISGVVTEANSAAILADLATLAGAISTGRMLITPPANTNVTEANSSAILVDLATLAGAVSSNKMATKAAANDIVDLASLLTKFNAALDGSGYVLTHQKLGGSDISQANPMPGSLAVGTALATWSSQPTQTAAATADTLLKFGSGGTTPGNHLSLQNNSSVTVYYSFDSDSTQSTSQVYTLAAAQAAFWDRAFSVLHCHSASQVAIGGTSGFTVEAFA